MFSIAPAQHFAVAAFAHDHRHLAQAGHVRARKRRSPATSWKPITHDGEPPAAGERRGRGSDRPVPGAIEVHLAARLIRVGADAVEGTCITSARGFGFQGLLRNRALRPLPSAFLSTLHHLRGQLRVRLGAARFRIIEVDRDAVARRLAELDIPGMTVSNTFSLK